ncbi:hypothetical protein DFJ73DRAFT_759766 [Zopfochytrium polystomum]|nr:hypothetical protein DFJ73DRAFT_759766 [Zopfochytrium polystomum]
MAEASSTLRDKSFPQDHSEREAASASSEVSRDNGALWINESFCQTNPSVSNNSSCEDTPCKSPFALQSTTGLLAGSLSLPIVRETSLGNSTAAFAPLDETIVLATTDTASSIASSSSTPPAPSVASESLAPLRRKGLVQSVRAASANVRRPYLISIPAHDHPCHGHQQQQSHHPRRLSYLHDRTSDRRRHRRSALLRQLRRERAKLALENAELRTTLAMVRAEAKRWAAREKEYLRM